MLRIVVDLIHRQSGNLLEIVNFNVEAEQYVCAGHVSSQSFITTTSRSCTPGPQHLCFEPDPRPAVSIHHWPQARGFAPQRF